MPNYNQHHHDDDDESIYSNDSNDVKPFDPTFDQSQSNKPTTTQNIVSKMLTNLSSKSKKSVAFSKNIDDIETQNNDDLLSNHLSNILSNPQAIDMIQSLARTLSRRTKVQMDHFEINDDDFDLKLLLNYLNAKSLEQGIESSSAGIAFKDLTAVGVDVSAAYASSVEEMLRGFFKWPLKFFKSDSTPIRQIIRNFTGVIEAGEMCFVVGRPGAGCSSLLKCCSGETADFVEVTGDFSYDGLSQKEMMDNYKGYIIYNPELDFHFPLITVKETVDFALKTKTPAKRIDGISRSEYINNMRDLWCTVFGLRHTYSTNVGNDFVRGVSGGERKRVSIVEALACNASIYSWDNATRGLDASTALEFTQAIRAATNLLNNSALVAIYQAGENIYQLFDKVTVLYLGKQIYFGPAGEARAYFEKMGWYKPDRMTTPEFLTSITDPNGRFPKPGYENTIPKTADEFEQYWLNSSEYQNCLAEYDQYIVDHPADDTRQRLALATTQRKQKFQRKQSQFVVTYFSQLFYLIQRGFQRAKGDLTYQVIYLSSFLTKGLIVGSMFYKIPSGTDGVYSRGGLLFYCLLFCALTSLAEIAHSFEHRPIVVKQKTYSMYHLSAEALQEIVTEIPIKFIGVIILCLTSYWMPHLKHEAGAFFQYMLFLLLIQQCMSFIFKFVATITKDGGTAHAIAGLWILMLSVYTGFIIPLPKMHHWIKWINWLNPMRYTYEQLLAVEFHGKKMACDNLIPSGNGYENVSIVNQICSVAGSIAGQDWVSGDSYITSKFRYHYSHVWRNFGINIAWTVAFIILNVLFSEFMKNVEGGGDMLLYKRGHLPKDASEAIDGKVASREEMMVALNGPNVDLKKVIAVKDVFSWQNLNYTIPYDGATRKLLDNIQGYVKPGTMTALMGESGAGKTTLLNTLAQRINFGVITGDMLVNGRPIDSSFKRRTGYVQQQDLHLSEYSVRESLRFAADLRQPKDVPQSEKYEYVEKIIDLLGMQNYAEAVVGKIGRGLNVEQRKKLSIGVELVAKPSLLLFLDEPTSGLDSQSAWSIIQFLRALADSGQAILCTIHQPSATLFEVFDRLLLLKKGGKTVYFGDIGENSSSLLNYFERQSGVKCGKSENPAEYILNRIGAGATASASSDWHDLWIQSPEYASTTREIALLHQELPKKPMPENSDVLKSRFATSYNKQMWCVLKRTFIQFWRSPVYIRAKFLECLLCALFVGFSFVGLNHSISAANGAISSVFMVLLISLAMINQLHVFAYDTRELFEVREAASNTFHWSCLLLSHTFVEIFWSTICEFLCFLCFWFPARQSGWSVTTGYFFLVYVIMFPIYFCSYGLWVLYFSPNVPSASMINSNLFASMLLFNGILQPAQFMPGFWTFMYKVSPYTYFVQSFVAPLVHNRPIHCSKDEYLVFDPPENQSCGEFMSTYIEDNGGYMEDADASSSCHYCEFTTQEEVVGQFNIKWSYRWRNFGFFFVYIIFNFAAMLICYYYMRVKVWSFKSILDFKSWFNGPRKERHEPETNIFAEKAGDDNFIKPKKEN
ncbi:plasma membrane ATP-binding cassette transporter [Ascoidea rubescens DSM 1968]|uniref:Plasma membrane ATP-binding cassette transporter n=1 Tax=Ascoidea rubescens DSM 1968 TaxID=1344418 RepID=A0A1D2VPK9_9ASCO|nr:plasma membrane ATP-binding cassette transporter [Ascoidea rubescens DSM 1968]ODV63548.1 plasma membrane ATP-binding cassette transporter [Ascoidea rubescens DSM 1968]